MTDQSGRQRTMLGDALEELQSALEALDRAAAPPQIGAHVDLAIHQLQAALAMTDIEFTGTRSTPRR